MPPSTPAPDTATALGRVKVPACLVSEPPPGTPAPDREGLIPLDVALGGGRIARLATAGTLAGAWDAGGRLLLPAFVDLHAHLDKGHIWPRSPNPDGTFDAALATVRGDRERRWRAADVRARFEFGLRCAWAHGTRAIRTHLDSIPPQAGTSFPVFAELREAWAGRIELQAVSLAMPEHYRAREGERLADLVAGAGGVLGLVPAMAPELDSDLDRFLGLAADRGLGIDLHVDETRDPAAATLRHLAEAILRRRFAGQAVAGHCCSLARQPEGEVDRTLALVAEAGIAVVSLPMCNLYLQDREPGRTPRWRGVTLLHEMRARGIPVAVASDNCRDPFHAYGDHDMHEVFREAARIAHLDHPVGDWPAAVTATPARIMGLAGPALVAPGAAADLVLLEGRSWNEALARPEAGRLVLRAGRPIDAAPPPYAELDRLMGGSA